MIEPGDILNSKWDDYHMLAVQDLPVKSLHDVGIISKEEIFIVIAKNNKPGLFILTARHVGWYFGPCEL